MINTKPESFVGAKVEFRDLPLSPSSNNQYVLIKRAGKIYHVPSKGLKDYQKEMHNWEGRNLFLLSNATDLIKSWIDIGCYLSCEAHFYFLTDAVYTKKQTIKKLDVSNRIKALHDQLCKILGIDDSLFFHVECIKDIVQPGTPEHVEVILRPWHTKKIEYI